MCNRVVSLILIPTLLLTQWVSAGHCHGCCQEAGHDNTPHVHLMGFAFTAATSRTEHRANPCHQCRHHHDDQESGDEESGNHEADDPVRHDEDSTDHGDGVVYLPPSVIHGWLTGRFSTTLDNAGGAPARSNGSLIHAWPLVCTHDPPCSMAVPDGPSYLRTLPLLI